MAFKQIAHLFNKTKDCESKKAEDVKEIEKLNIPALDLSKYIICYSKDNNIDVTNLKLQKLLYFIEREFLKNTPSRSLIKENMEAWKFGPVIPDVYYNYSVFGASPIKPFFTTDLSEKLEKYRKILTSFGLNKSDINNINSIIEKYGKKQAWDLVNQTHEKGKAWDRVYIPGQSNIISVEDIIKYD